MAASQAELNRRISYLLHAVSSVSDKGKDRDLLAEGDAQEVSGIITGSVGRADVAYPFAGRLLIGHDTTVASSSAPKVHQVMATLLANLPRATRERALGEQADAYSSDRALFDLPKDQCLTERAQLLHGLQVRVEELLKGLRTSVPQLRRGAVRFEPTTVVT